MATMTPAIVEMALVLMNRAPLKGAEAKNVAITIEAFENMLNTVADLPEPNEKDLDKETP